MYKECTVCLVLQGNRQNHSGNMSNTGD